MCTYVQVCLTEGSHLAEYLLALQTRVQVSSLTTGNDPQFVDHPTEFDPDRWVKGSTPSVHPFASFPFGFGARGCIGTCPSCWHNSFA